MSKQITNNQQLPIVNRQSNTTNTTIQPKIQIGWGYIQGGGSAFASKTVTMPVAFSTDYILSISQAGYKDTAAPTTVYDTSGAYEVPTLASRPLTNQTFTAIFNSPGTTIPSTRYILFHWIAIGTPA
jgi:hypothetical protein